MHLAEDGFRMKMNDMNESNESDILQRTDCQRVTCLQHVATVCRVVHLWTCKPRVVKCPFQDLSVSYRIRGMVFDHGYARQKQTLKAALKACKMMQHLHTSGAILLTSIKLQGRNWSKYQLIHASLRHQAAGLDRPHPRLFHERCTELHRKLWVKVGKVGLAQPILLCVFISMLFATQLQAMLELKLSPHGWSLLVRKTCDIQRSAPCVPNSVQTDQFTNFLPPSMLSNRKETNCAFLRS